MPVVTSRQHLADDLRSYGEDELAARVPQLSDADMNRIGDLADRYLFADEYATPSGGSMLIAKALALAAIEVMEGAPRELRRKRRRLQAGPAPDFQDLRAGEQRGGRQVTADLWSTVQAIGLKKTLAARSRARPRPADALAPRELFLSVAADVAALFGGQGYTYAKSGPHISRKSGSYRFEVHFGSSSHNVAGEYVALDIGAMIRSKALKEWRLQQPRRTTDSDIVVAAGLNLLMGLPAWVEWNLAKSDRADTVSDVAQHVERHVLPWFDWFEREDELVEHLRAGSIAEFDGSKAVEWLASIDRLDIAAQHAQWWFGQDPDWLPEYRRALNHHRAGGDVQIDSGTRAASLARVIVAYELDVPIDGDR